MQYRNNAYHGFLCRKVIYLQGIYLVAIFVIVYILMRSKKLAFNNF
jgi:hypothetical protein